MNTDNIDLKTRTVSHKSTGDAMQANKSKDTARQLLSTSFIIDLKQIIWSSKIVFTAGSLSSHHSQKRMSVLRAVFAMHHIWINQENEA